MSPCRENMNKRAPTLLLLLAAACSTPLGAGVEANTRLAEAASRQGDWAAAADLWHRVYMAGEFQSPRACLGTSRALWELGDPDSAEALLRDGLRRFPEDAALYELHGVVLEETGYRRAAEGAYARAVELQSGLIVSLEGLGRVRLQLGLESAAIAPLRRLVELEAEPEALRMLARAARGAGELVLAYDTLLHLFDDTGGTVEELMLAGTLGLESGLHRVRRASPIVCEAWLGRVLEVDPQRTDAHVLLGTYRMRAGDDAGAALHLRRACETDPACAVAFLDLAEVHLRLGETESARALLEHADAIVDGDAARTRLSTLRSRVEEQGLSLPQDAGS
jgi:tetratricopeptide (TPR) repeat protein